MRQTVPRLNRILPCKQFRFKCLPYRRLVFSTHHNIPVGSTLQCGVRCTYRIPEGVALTKTPPWSPLVDWWIASTGKTVQLDLNLVWPSPVAAVGGGYRWRTGTHSSLSPCRVRVWPTCPDVSDLRTQTHKTVASDSIRCLCRLLYKTNSFQCLRNQLYRKYENLEIIPRKNGTNFAQLWLDYRLSLYDCIVQRQTGLVNTFLYS